MLRVPIARIDVHRTGSTEIERQRKKRKTNRRSGHAHRKSIHRRKSVCNGFGSAEIDRRLIAIPTPAIGRKRPHDPIDCKGSEEFVGTIRVEAVSAYSVDRCRNDNPRDAEMLAMIGRIPSVLCNVTEKQKQLRGRVLSRLDSFLLLLLLLLNKEFAVARQRRDHRGRADSLHLWKGFVELLKMPGRVLRIA